MVNLVPVPAQGENVEMVEENNNEPVDPANPIQVAVE
jgi:hypothetical protein